MTHVSAVGCAVMMAVVLVVSVGADVTAADPRQRFAEETGLDLDLIGVIQTEAGGTEMTVTFVFVNDRTFDSRISLELREALSPYVGRNALYVNPSIEQVVAQSAFSTTDIAVRQDGELFVPRSEAWIEITPGFRAGRFEVNPRGPDQGSGSEGILVLDQRIDSTRPFELLYRGEVTRFDIGTWAAPVGSPAASSSASHDPVDVSPLADTGSLQDVLMHDEFSSGAMAALLGLDPRLVRTLTLNVRGEELRLLFVRVTEAIRQGALGEELLTALDPLIGTGAVMVWAFSVEGAPFSPWSFFIQQGGTNYVFFSSASFVELTERFLRVERVPAGEVVAGVIRLPKGVDPELPFSVVFSTSSVDYP